MKAMRKERRGRCLESPRPSVQHPRIPQPHRLILAREVCCWPSDRRNRLRLPWKEEPVQLSEWTEVKHAPRDASVAPYGDFFQFFQNGKLMAIRFDRKTRTVGEPYELKFLPGSEVVRPEDARLIRGPGLVFTRQEPHASVWLMKLPE